MNAISYFAVSVLGLGGFALAFNIFHKKRAGQKLVCPIGHDCDPVIYSKYAKFFGIPLEYLGMTYYALVASGYLLLGLGISILPNQGLWLLALTAFGFLFSLYLTSIQAFVLRKWCTWCLISATICTTVVLIEIGLLKFAVLPFLVSLQPFTTGLHILALAIGVGTVTISEVFFLKFLRDYRISREEADVLHTLAEVVWLALAVLFVTQIMTALVTADSVPRDLFQSIVIGIIIINSAFLNLILTPRLALASSGENHIHIPGELTRLRHTAFFLSAVSIASWYGVFFTNFVSENGHSTFGRLFTIYGALFAVVLIMNHLLEVMTARPEPDAKI